VKVIYVHGIAQEGKDPAELKKKWDAALQEGFDAADVKWPAGMETVLTYYGDMLAAKTAEVDKGEAMGLVKRGTTESEDAQKSEFYAEMLTEMAKSRGVPIKGLTSEDGKPVKRGIQNWPFVLALARQLSKVGAVADWTIDTFTRDVWVYLRHFTVQQPIDEIVDQKIPSAEPCVVVSHSLGTVVAYNVLMAREPRNNVVAWFTLGSPLGTEAVYKRIPRHYAKVIPRSAPDGVGSWYNARDKDDIVALHPVPRGSFAGSPAVANANHVVNTTSNQHGIEGYLSDAEVARRIAKAAR
jgi:hypothetical protein